MFYRGVSLKANSVHAFNKAEVKVKPDFEYITRRQSSLFKLYENLVSEKGDNIDWNYNSNTLDVNDVNEMWKEFNRKMKSIMQIF